MENSSWNLKTYLNPKYREEKRTGVFAKTIGVQKSHSGYTFC